jgi:hypothetical protein
VAIEDAGFEIRDNIAWMYASGFPKSLDVSKAIDKSDAKVERRARDLRFTSWMRSTGMTAKQINQLTNSVMGSHYLTDKEQPAVPTEDMFTLLRPYLPDVPEDIERLVFERTVESKNFAEREVIGQGADYGHAVEKEIEQKFGFKADYDITAPATSEAQKWQGWGTALKPAFEPVVVGRKPIQGTVANNVLEWGVGGLNIDGSRIGTTVETWPSSRSYGGGTEYSFTNTSKGPEYAQKTGKAPDGRWPANVILDEVTAGLLDEQSGVSKDGVAVKRNGVTSNGVTGWGKAPAGTADAGGYGGSGGASRFFMVADTLEHDRMSVCEHTNANNVATLLNTIRATSESSAPTNVLDSQDELNAQLVKSAGIQCDSCATHIAADLVALKTLASGAETSPLFHRSISDLGSSILTQSLVSLVEQWASTDTIPTMTDFSTLFGCVLLATDELTKPVSLESDNGRSRFIYQAKASKRDRNEGLEDLEATTSGDMVDRVEGSAGMNSPRAGAGRTSGAKNHHPTVKPTALMRYLIKLVTPEGGVVLDPFTGSGSTGKAALLDGFEFVGAELTEDYLPIIEGRLKWAVENREDGALF